MAERSPSHSEQRYLPEELGLNTNLAEDAQLYNDSEGIRAIGHAMLSLRQVTAMHYEGTISDVQYEHQLSAHHNLIDGLRTLYDELEP